MSGIENTTTGLILLAAATVVGTAVKKEFFDRNAGEQGAHQPAPQFLANWQDLRAVGTQIGDSKARATLVVFSDFECPFCQKFHKAYLQAKAEMGNDLALVFIRMPIPGHRFATPAILASQCAEDQGHFPQMADALFAKQDSLGLKSWISYASDAGVTDTLQFASCLKGASLTPRTAAGIQKAAELSIKGTPTVLVNGWRYTGFPSDSLLAIIKARSGDLGQP